MIAAITAWLSARMVKLVIVGCLLLAALAGGAFLVYRHDAPKIASLQQQLVTAQAGERAAKASAGAYKAAADKVTRTYQQRSKDLSNALDSSRSWADAPVPDAVYDSLFGAGKADPTR